MIRRVHAAVVAAVFLLAANVLHAGDEASFRQALGSLSGSWAGHLEYRDYQSDKLVRIPHARTISLPPDGAYLLAELRFTDPGYQVYSAEVTTVNWPRVEQAYASNGSLELQQFTVTQFQMQGDGWTAQLDGDGNDAGKPALLRLLMTVDGGQLTFEKQVRGASDPIYQFRNAVRLTRGPDDS